MIKKVVTAGYAHKSNIKELADRMVPDEYRDKFFHFISLVNDACIQYDVVKYDKGNVTLVTSPDWDTAHEPIVGICMRWKAGEWFLEDGSLNTGYTVRKNFRQIYHNKWQFVSESYQGFNIEEEKKRTREWNKIPNLDKKRIGNKIYWEELLKQNNIGI